MSTLRVYNIENPSTAAGGIGIATDGSVTVGGLQYPTAGPLSNRNLIINGAMQVAQRGTSETSVTTGGYYTVDRFKYEIGSLGTWTLEQSTDSPDGFSNSFKLTCTTADASPASSDYSIVSQSIEAQNLQHLEYGSSSAKPLTLSFYVKSNKTGNASFEIFQEDNSSKLYSVQYTINSADTWEKKTITIPGDTSGLINNDNGVGLRFGWWLNSGSNFTGGSFGGWKTLDNTSRNVSNLGVGGAISDYFAITGVQLEVGERATPFEHESYGQTLAKCMRYYYRWVASADYGRFASGLVINSTQTRVIYNLPVPMRIPPTSINALGPLIHYDGTVAQPLNGLAIEQNNTHSVSFNSASAIGGLTIGRGALVGANNSTTTYIGISAEL